MLQWLTPTMALTIAVLFPFPVLAGDSAPPDDPRVAERLYFGDETVESATRVAKPLSRTPENVAVVHADEIEAMGAHTLAEVLNRVPGVFVQFFGHHFGSAALPHIQGSGETDFAHAGANDTHVTVLLDGMPWNSLSDGAFLDSIPVGIIDRIEIIKGPASSTWGSALGGVVNVLTKKVGKAPTPHGGLSASYGERRAWDLGAEAAGAAGPVGYYLQGQRQHAEWDHADGSFKSWAGFGKAEAQLGSGATLTLSAGKGRPERDNGELANYAVLAQEEVQARFARLGLDLRLADSLAFHAAAYRYDQRILASSQEDGTFGPRGELARDWDEAERHAGGQGRLAWTPAAHTLVLGVDCAKGQLDLSIDSGAAFQSAGMPPHLKMTPSLWRWGVYLNDTMSIGSLTLTPGIRYDRPSLSHSFTSPSLGITWRLGPQTVLRASASRGFTLPPLTFLEGGGVSIDPNPDLKPEEDWSYQAGVETAALRIVWLKANLFRHEMSNSFEQGTSSGPKGQTILNGGSTWRTGFELEAETVQLGGLAAKAGFVYVNVDKVGPGRDQDVYQAKVELSFQSRPWRASAFGDFVWWDLGRGAHEGRHNDFLWDATVSRTVVLFGGLDADLFATAHNIFNGSQDIDTDRRTEHRWFEGGLRLRF